MNENLYEAQYSITKKNKIQKLYEENKTLIFSSLAIILILVGSLIYYSSSKEKKKILLADNYIQAKIYLKKNNKAQASDVLKSIIFSNDSTYSPLSLFLIVNENLIEDQNEIIRLFEHILENNKFEKEIQNLIIFKKALFQSDFVNQEQLLQSLNTLITNDSLWKPHALLLLGNYFLAKNEYSESKKYYSQILSLKNLHQEMYEQARSKLVLIQNE